MTFTWAFDEGLVLMKICHFLTLTALARRDDRNRYSFACEPLFGRI